MIIRKSSRTSYTVIDNALIEDSRLSWKARGMLIYLLSKPDGWRVMTSQLVGAGPGGREAVRGILGELENAGYIVRSTGRGVGGKFDGLDVEVHESPQVTPETAFPAPVDPAPANPPRVSTNSLASTEKEYSSAFETLWKTYPRHIGKAAAYKKYQATLKRGATHNDLAISVAAYADRCAEDATEEKFIKHAATFLGPDEHWRDYLPAAAWVPSAADLRTASQFDDWCERGIWTDDANCARDNMPPIPVHPDGGLFDAEGRRYHWVPNSNPRRRQYD